MNLGTVFRWPGKTARSAPGGAAGNAARQPSVCAAPQRVVIQIAELWAHQGHATLSNRRLGEGVVAYGEPVDDASMALLQAALAGEAVDIVVTRDPQGKGSVIGLGPLVWDAVLTTWTSSHEVFARLSYELWEGPAWGRVTALPLGDALREVVARRGGGRHLNDLLREAHLDPMMVAMELSALSRLAVIELRRTGESSSVSQRVRVPQALVDLDEDLGSMSTGEGSMSSASSRNDARSGGATSVSISVSRRVERRRSGRGVGRDLDDLHRKLRILMKRSPHRALGLGRAATEDEISAAAEQLRSRYGARPDDSDEVKAVLADLHAQVTRIRRALAKERKQAPTAGEPTMEPKLEKGCSLLERDGPTAALTILEQALGENPTSGAHHAWYGWALFLSPSRPVQERAFLALEHLRTARTLGGPAELPTFLARVERALCDPESERNQPIGIDLGQQPTESQLHGGGALD